MARGFGGHSAPSHVQSYPTIVKLALFSVTQFHATHDDFHGQEEARSGFADTPVENTFMYNVYARVSRAKCSLLQLYHISTNFDNIILGAVIDLWILFSKIVQYVHGESPVAGS